jgi:hypothetical protein
MANTTTIDNCINLLFLQNFIAMEQLAAEQRKVNKKQELKQKPAP